MMAINAHCLRQEDAREARARKMLVEGGRAVPSMPAQRAPQQPTNKSLLALAWCSIFVNVMLYKRVIGLRVENIGREMEVGGC